MFGGGWGRLAARGEGSGGGDGGVALGLSPFFLSLELHKPRGASPGRDYEDGISTTKNLVLNIFYGVE